VVEPGFFTWIEREKRVREGLMFGLGQDETILDIGGGYVGATTPPGPGYATVDTVNAPNLPTPGISDWLQANKSTVYLASGVLVLMAMFGGRRR